MKLNTYLGFAGSCAEAFAFYQSVFGGEIPMTMTFGESPVGDQFPAEWSGKVMHTRLIFGENQLMGCDAPPGRFEKPQGMHVTINVDTPEEADRIYTALSDKAESIVCPIAETFWAKRFAMFVDQYGTPWMINCEKTP